ncbi:MAG: DNA polymerase/3'-5' exonuclease PolX [Bryobacteraceae bacterium]|nr:DNA polymerase/3'-5' exonuclease PolX [Bryobacteraceae bacterium]
MENPEIARMLAETADLMEIAGEDPFRIRSYRNAAAAIENHPERIVDILRDPSRDVTAIPGIGKGLAAALREIAERGSFARRDEMLAKYPPTALELLRIPGVGPKTVRALWEHFRVSTIEDLARLCEEHRIRELRGMGARTEQKILEGIAHYRQVAGRFLLNHAAAVAAELAPLVNGTPAGSLRRGKETVGDLDILSTDPGAIGRFLAHPSVHEVLAHGETKASARFGAEGLQVDVRVIPPESFGAALQYFTGSRQHNVALRQRALKMGFTLNEYGLFTVEGQRRVAGDTEEGVYEALGLAWIPPELRENHGEIEAAERRALPALIEERDIRGDLHMHTRESDGRATLEEMAEAARQRGYAYIAITDHSKALAMANGLDEKRAVAFAAEVRRFNASGRGIEVLSGLECDILRDGRLDLAEDALLELDFVVASVHSYMNLEPAEMTARLLRALESPAVKALGHPTGRVLLHRDAYAYEFETVAKEAARRGVWLEINASPERLDLHAALIRRARELGCRFVISTDAHHPKHLANMRYGVQMARRGWLTASDVVNTMEPGALRAALRRQA